MWTLGSLAYTVGLGVKMSLLLALPAIGVILFLARGIKGSLTQLWLMVQVQVIIALPFVAGNTFGYLSRAFELSRQFLFKWTVNWRFIGEDTFLSREFSIALLVGHVSVLALFATTRWLRPASKPIMEMVQNALKLEEPLKATQHAVSIRVSPNYILTTILTANAIGVLFARSLHYQFYSYIAWATPFLLWRGGMHPILQYGVWAVQEWAWNVYPSTDASSMVVVGILFATVASIWWGTKEDFVNRKGDGAADKKAT
jgi:alpha-1,3-mannosyltransferase